VKTWQFWTLFGVLMLQVIALSSILDAVKSLWTKLHELQRVIGHIPVTLDPEEHFEKLWRKLERLENAAYSYHPRDPSEID
jgi:hypothetical protein